ncbi:hypothetical protein MLD38_012953 [Melastoma candidum]|uniref:Uncharacterized protein n=1 Tax=Melastoma candidum TaxID=119954 RepID=A0ACB9R8L6_9MYRT|nr:hypothetical protein MLD38_012953 [Melastoma candidum]
MDLSLLVSFMGRSDSGYRGFVVPDSYLHAVRRQGREDEIRLQWSYGKIIFRLHFVKLTPLDWHLAGTTGGTVLVESRNGATVGKFSVIWNFRQVKNGAHECYLNQGGLKSCYCYKIVPEEESIVASRFMHEKFAVTDSCEAPLVIATPLKVSSFSISSRHCLRIFRISPMCHISSGNHLL